MRTSGGRKTFTAQLGLRLVALLEVEAHAAQDRRRLRELHVAVVDRLHVVAPRVAEVERGRMRHLHPGRLELRAQRVLVVDDEAEVPVGVGRLRASAREREELVAHVDERHRPARPRSARSKNRPYHASASSTSPTSSATWLMPTSFTIAT